MDFTKPLTSEVFGVQTLSDPGWCLPTRVSALVAVFVVAGFVVAELLSRWKLGRSELGKAGLGVVAALSVKVLILYALCSLQVQWADILALVIFVIGISGQFYLLTGITRHVWMLLQM